MGFYNLDQRMKIGDLKWFSIKSGGTSGTVTYPVIPGTGPIQEVANKPSNFPGFLAGIDAGVDIYRLVKVCQGKDTAAILEVANEFAEKLNIFANWQASVPPFSSEARGLQSILDNIDSDMAEPVKVGETI